MSCAKFSSSLSCGSYSDLVSSENPTSSPIADPDLLVLHEQAILPEFPDTIEVTIDTKVCHNHWSLLDSANQRSFKGVI